MKIWGPCFFRSLGVGFGSAAGLAWPGLSGSENSGVMLTGTAGGGDDLQRKFTKLIKATHQVASHPFFMWCKI